MQTHAGSSQDKTRMALPDLMVDEDLPLYWSCIALTVTSVLPKPPWLPAIAATANGAVEALLLCWAQRSGAVIRTKTQYWAGAAPQDEHSRRTVWKEFRGRGWECGGGWVGKHGLWVSSRALALAPNISHNSGRRVVASYPVLSASLPPSDQPAETCTWYLAGRGWLLPFAWLQSATGRHQGVLVAKPRRAVAPRSTSRRLRTATAPATSPETAEALTQAAQCIAAITNLEPFIQAFIPGRTLLLRPPDFWGVCFACRNEPGRSKVQQQFSVRRTPLDAI
ncbi:hypothetical protein G7046_g6600 [Stylonectria norvegica]|nr:hypothetical protein G7046_g6600 [Stylonectria norvegica]